MEGDAVEQWEEKNLRLEEMIFSSPTIHRVTISGNKPIRVKTVDLESMTATSQQIVDAEESYNAAQVAVKSRVFQVGGKPSYDKSWEILPELGEIKPRANLNFGRQYPACEVVWKGEEAYIYVVGGTGKDDKILKECEKYTVSLNIWEVIQPLNEPKSSTGLTQFNSEFLYSFGGFSGGKALSIIERLSLDDPKGKWVKLLLEESKGWTARLNPGCVQINSDNILIFGGYYQTNMLEETYLFNVKHRTMLQLSQNLVKRDSFLFSISPSVYEERMGAFGINGDLHVYNFEQRKWKMYTEDQF